MSLFLFKIKVKQLNRKFLESCYEELNKEIVINLVENNIICVDDSTFKDLVTVRAIYLQKNLISHIEPDSFQSLINLKELNLSHNNLALIEYGTLSSLVNLKEIYLQNNKLESIYGALFAGLEKLEIIDLSFNQIGEIDPLVFKGLVNLEEIYLHENKLKKGKFKLYFEPSVNFFSFRNEKNNIKDVVSLFLDMVALLDILIRFF